LSLFSVTDFSTQDLSPFATFKTASSLFFLLFGLILREDVTSGSRKRLVGCISSFMASSRMLFLTQCRILFVLILQPHSLVNQLIYSCFSSSKYALDKVMAPSLARYVSNL